MRGQHDMPGRNRGQCIADAGYQAQNRIEPEPGCRFLKTGYAYFANSYRLRQKGDGWAAAFSDYGGPFVAAMERGDVLACQFHPELSGEFGLDLMRRWLSAGRRQGGKGC